MTPLAHKIVSELTIPIRQRRFDHSSAPDLLKGMSGVHCFEISAAFDLIDGLGERLHADSIKDGKYTRARLDEDLAFLPAPRTWIEWTADDPGERNGVLVWADTGSTLAIVTVCVDQRLFFGSIDQFALPLRGFDDFGEFRVRLDGRLNKAQQISLIFRIYAALAVINTPKIIFREQHMPHRGLQRELLKRQTMIGKFPLRAWTEIKLDCKPPADFSDEPGFEAHLTGRKCLHFCRAHLRIRNGNVEFVRSHWRGDPALGIKQSRYIVTQ